MTNPYPYDVAVIGAGPAGIMAALAAASLGARVLLLESQKRLGGNIMVSGNGRCNLSNSQINAQSSDYTRRYRNGRFAHEILQSYDSAWLQKLFASWGLAFSDQDGWLFPVTRYAGSVLETLTRELERSKVTVRTACPVQTLRKTAEGFEIVSMALPAPGQQIPAPGQQSPAPGHAGQSQFFSRTVVLACNVRGMPIDTLTQLTGIYQPLQPVLCPLHLTGPGQAKTELKALDGLRVNCRLRLLRQEALIHSEFGEVLFRGYGLSGIVTFNASRYAQAGDEVSLDFRSAWTEEDNGVWGGAERSPEIAESLLNVRSRYPQQSSDTLFDGRLRRALGKLILLRAGIEAERKIADISDAELQSLVRLCADFRWRLSGSPFHRQQAQVQRGGVPVGGLQAKTLESRQTAGLFAAGELVDVDGPCGGYNLHWAWASGWAAGLAASQAAKEAG